MNEVIQDDDEESVYSEFSNSTSSASLSNQEDASGISDNESTCSFNEAGREDEVNQDFNKKLHRNTDMTVGECVYIIIDYYIKNSLTKKALTELLTLLNTFLPKPNNLPKTKYFLFKFLDSVLPDSENVIKKHRICENCSEYLGDWSIQPPIINCQNCSSTKVRGLFVEYNLELALKDAFEFRNLKTLIDDFSVTNNENVVSDITSSVRYKELRREVIKEKYDLTLLWNTDGVPFSNSSNGQVWLVQAQIINIPPQNRRNYQFVCGIYYSRLKKPDMSSFLWPFVKRLQNLYEGIDWYDRETKSIIHSTIIAPIATLDAPARAAVQNINQFNGECGCTFCEHLGQTCETGKGFNRVYPMSSNENPTLRTKKRMYLQAQAAVRGNANHINGVKGPSVAALIPQFDVAASFLPDYMHAILLGVCRMLFKLWFSPKYKNCLFYIKKKFRDEIDQDLQNIYPPDFVTREPGSLKDIKFLKAAQIREYLLNYFPILLNGRLNKKYYDHFLLLVYATRLLLQSEIHIRQIEIAECLLNLFVMGVETLYGLEKCSFNVHQLTHIAGYVLLWGPLHSWSAFPFEDANGYIKRKVHGSNKLDVEIANTLKILNAHKILRYKLGLLRNNENNNSSDPVALGKAQAQSNCERELHLIQEFCQAYNNELINVKIFSRIQLSSVIITSQIYKKQRKRNNFYVFLNDMSFGCILYFLEFDHELYVVIRKLVHDNQALNICVSTIRLDFSTYIVPFRETHCICIVPVTRIKGKVTRVKNYLCLPANMCEKK